jgi:hypothetical protein
MHEGKGTASANCAMPRQLSQKTVNPAEEKDRKRRISRQDFSGNGAVDSFLPHHRGANP